MRLVSGFCWASAFLWLLVSPVWASVGPTTPVEFWFVEANEGESAGGHAAIRIAEIVYHVERRDDGLIADRRTDRLRFERIYRQRGNRRIEAIPLALERSEVEALRRRLETRFFDRSHKLDRVDALDDWAQWLEQGSERNLLSMGVPGLGLFASAEGSTEACAAPGNAALAGLVRESSTHYPVGWLAERQRAAEAEINRRLKRWVNTARDVARDGATSDAGVHGNDEGPGGAIRRLQEAAQRWAAIEVFSSCRAVKADRILSTGITGDFSLARVREARDALGRDLVRMLESQRSDGGLALLLQVARWAALDRTLVTGELHVVDSSPEGDSRAPRLESFENAIPGSWIPRLEARAKLRRRAAVAEFESNTGVLETQLNSLEAAEHGIRHVRSRTLHQPAARSRAELSPSASPRLRFSEAEVTLPWPDGLTREFLEILSSEVRDRARLARSALASELGYGLMTRNCVTELNDVLNTAVSPRLDRRESVQKRDARTLSRLLSLEFVPEIAARAIEERLAAGPRRTLLSARDTMLAETRAESADAWFWLRESTTLTSRSYVPHDEDSSFLFFSDGPRWIRPPIGLANFGYGLGGATIGMFSAPFDRGVRLRRGLVGALMSVPELVFFQVRHGTYRVPPPGPSGGGATRSQPLP